MQSQAETMPSTEGQEPSSSPPKKKTAMAELFGDVFKKHEQVVRPLVKIIEDEVASYWSAYSIDVDADPFMWSKTNESKFPHVAKVAQRHLCVLGTSVPSERIFSTARDIVSATRSRLAADNVDRLIFLKKKNHNSRGRNSSCQCWQIDIDTLHPECSLLCSFKIGKARGISESL